jgi:hypothetical protein
MLRTAVEFPSQTWNSPVPVSPDVGIARCDGHRANLHSTLVVCQIAQKCYFQPSILDLFFSASSSGGGLPGRL